MSDSLPAPDERARRHSDALANHISTIIDEAGGAIGFERFMDLCLYAPGLGYYAAGITKFGEGGDFVTAPELSPLFSRCVARQIGDVLQLIPGGEVLEVGAGTGQMAREVIATLGEGDLLPSRYLILETSPELKARQRAMLESTAEVPDGLVEWVDGLPPAGFRGVIVANEVLDALTTNRVRIDERNLLEICVANDGGGFRYTERRAGPELEDAWQSILEGLESAPEPGYVTEINRQRTSWLRATLSALSEGLLLLFDYGYPRREYYHPQRRCGTLSCFYRHRTHDDPLILVGLQDITSHVDFTAIAEAALNAGAELKGFTTQANFLLATGITRQIERLQPGTREHAMAAGAVKRLMLPGEMGDVMKVMGLSRALPEVPVGFTERDLSRSL